MRAFKSIHGPDRPLTKQELDKCRRKCRDGWDILSENEKAQWRLVHESKLQGRLRDRADGKIAGKSAITQGPIQQFQPLWHGGPERLPEPDQPADQPLPLSAMADAHCSKSKKDRRVLAWSDPDLRVSSPVQARASQGGPYPAEHVFGCFGRKKNICRACLPASNVSKLDTLCGLFNAWAKSLGEEASKTASLLLLSGVGKADVNSTCSLIVLLVDTRLSPKMQFFTYCVLPDAPEQVHVSVPAEFPFRIKIAVRASRISARFRTVYDVTSDELALKMVKLEMNWRLTPLTWAWPDDGGLLDMDVIGRGEEFKPTKIKVAARAATPVVIPDIFALDPFAAGRAAAGSSSRRSGVAGDGVAPVSGNHDANSESDSDKDMENCVDPSFSHHADADAMDGLSDGDCSDIAVVLGDVMEVGSGVFDFDGVGSEAAPEEEQETDAEVEVAAVEESCPEELPEEPESLLDEVMKPVAPPPVAPPRVGVPRAGLMSYEQTPPAGRALCMICDKQTIGGGWRFDYRQRDSQSYRAVKRIHLACLGKLPLATRPQDVMTLERLQLKPDLPQSEYEMLETALSLLRGNTGAASSSWEGA